jgi:hypothetical protein
LKNTAAPTPEGMEHVARFYELLSDLFEPYPLERVVDELLDLLVDITGAAVAYIEAPMSSGEAFRTAHPRGDAEAVRRLAENEVIKVALSERRTISTPCAMLDDRFAGLSMVQRDRLQSVLCAPVRVQGLMGVIYLQDAQDLSALPRQLIEKFAAKLGRRLAWPIGLTGAMTMEDATTAFKRWFALELLEGNRWRATAVAEILGISRSTLYELVSDLSARRRFRTG